MMCMKEENKRSETVKVFSMTRKKSLWTSKFTAKKYMPNNWKKKSKTIRITSVLILALFYNV